MGFMHAIKSALNHVSGLHNIENADPQDKLATQVRKSRASMTLLAMNGLEVDNLDIYRSSLISC